MVPHTCQILSKQIVQSLISNWVHYCETMYSWAIKVMILANRNCRTALDHTMISAVGTLQILPLYTWNTALQKVQSLGRIHSFDWEITMSCPYVSELPPFQRLQNEDRTSAWEATNNLVAEDVKTQYCPLEFLATHKLLWPTLWPKSFRVYVHIDSRNSKRQVFKKLLAAKNNCNPSITPIICRHFVAHYSVISGIIISVHYMYLRIWP